MACASFPPDQKAADRPSPVQSRRRFLTTSTSSPRCRPALLCTELARRGVMALPRHRGLSCFAIGLDTVKLRPWPSVAACLGMDILAALLLPCNLSTLPQLRPRIFSPFSSGRAGTQSYIEASCMAFRRHPPSVPSLEANSAPLELVKGFAVFPGLLCSANLSWTRDMLRYYFDD